MRSQWNTDEDDVPAKVGQAWGKTKAGASTGKVVAIAASVVAVVLIIAFVAAMATTGGGSGADLDAAGDDTGETDPGGDAPADANYPGDGTYTVQARHTGYCLGITEVDDDRKALVQMACKKAKPDIRLTESSTVGTYAVGLGDDCLALDADEAGKLLGPADCAEDPLQSFGLVPVDDGVYRMTTAGGLCLDVAEQSAEPDAPLAAAECSTTAASQQFSFDGQGAVASLPTKLGAWWARDGVFSIKWEEPDDDGGLEITGYVVRDCDQNDLTTVDGSTYTVDVEIKALTCVSVRAVNDAGEGAEATTDVVQKK